MDENQNTSAEEALARHQFEIDRLKEALALLGVAPCSCCEKFFRRTEPGSLFDGGQLVCYGCVREWWPTRGAQLDTKEHENLEGKLVFWLRDYHHAETFKDPAKLPESSQQELCLVANCLECKGTGKSMGQENCRFCEGRGTVWVIVPRKKS
jgi:hypothetical protein